MTQKIAGDIDAVYDLNQFAKGLPTSFGKLKKRIRRWRDAHSVSADLTHSIEMIELALRQHRTRRSSLGYSKMALQQSAIMNYNRAVEKSNRKRGEVSIVGKLTTAQQEFHEKLLELRHESLAHFGDAGHDISWSEDAAILIQTGPAWQPAVSARRRLFDKDFAVLLHDHLVVVASLVEAEVTKRRKEFQELFDLDLQNQDVQEALIESKISLDEAERLYGPALTTHRDGRLIVHGPTPIAKS